MAIFNPEDPQVNPANFIGWSREIQQSKGDTSKGELFKTAGQAVDIAATGVDRFMKRGLDNQVYAKVDEERDQFGKALAATKDAQSASQPTPDQVRNQGLPDDPLWKAQTWGVAPKADKPPMSLLNDTSPEGGNRIPEPIQSIDGSMAGLKAAADGGKISPTYYYQRLAAFTKNLRDQNPGYRDYIDERVHAVTGVNPANAYIRSIIEDINRSGNLARERENKVEAFAYHLMGQGVDNAAVHLNNVINGKETASEFRIWGNEQLAMKSKIAAAKGAMELQDLQEKERKRIATNTLRDGVNSSLMNYYETVRLGSDYKTMKQYNTFADEIAAGRRPRPSATEAQQLAVQVQAVYNAIWTKEWQEAQKGGKDSHVAVLGGEAVQKEITEQMRSLKDVVDRYANGEFAIANIIPRINKAISDGVENHFLTTEQDMASYYLKMGLAEKYHAGPAVINEIQRKMSIEGVPTRFAGWNIQNTLDMYTQPGEAKGRVKTFDEVVDQGARNGAWEYPQTYQSYIDSVGQLTDPSVDPHIKHNIISFFFDSKNGAIMDRFNQEYIDSNGNEVPGQYGVFTQLTEPKVADAIRRNSTIVDWQKYQNWAERSFAKLYRNQIADMSTLGENPWITVHWDNDKHNFKIDHTGNYKGPNEGGIVDVNTRAVVFSGLEYRIKLLNRALDSMSHTETLANNDPNAHVLGVLRDAGVKLDGVQGLPTAMAKAIIAEQGKHYTVEEATGGRTKKEYERVPAGPNPYLNR